MFIVVYIFNYFFFIWIDIIHINVYYILIGKLIFMGKILKYCWFVFILCLVYDLIILEKIKIRVNEFYKIWWCNIDYIFNVF